MAEIGTIFDKEIKEMMFCIFPTNIREPVYEILVDSDKTILSSYDHDSCTVTATLLQDNIASVGKTLNYQVKHNNTVISSGSGVTDANGEVDVSYSATGVGDVEFIFEYGNLLQETYEVEDCLKVGISSSDTWHNINNSNTMSVSDGVATGYNRLLDYNWDNSIDWEVSCSYKCNGNSPNGLLFADVTNTNNYDKDCFEVFQGSNRSYLEINGNTNGSNWVSQATSYQSRQYNTIRVTNINGELSFYINDVLQRTHSNIPAITNICIGLYSWQNGTGSFKDLKIKAL